LPTMVNDTMSSPSRRLPQPGKGERLEIDRDSGHC
jgi:hypothetical protein